MKKMILLVLALVLLSTAAVASFIRSVIADGTIYIKADGSVDPPTAPISSVDNVTYTFTGNISEPIVVQRDNIVIDGSNHSVQGTGTETGITLSSRSNVTVKNTKVMGFEYGIHLNYSEGCTILGNSFLMNSYYGIWLYSSSNNIISSNIVGVPAPPFSWKGIILLSSNNNTLFNNIATYNTDHGIYLSGSNNNTLLRNTATYNGRHGILLDGFSSKNTLSGNTVTNNMYDGIKLYYSSNNTVIGNTAITNRYGISLDTSDDNTIFHNNFINNGVGQAYTTNSINTWDNGSSGNFWSDYPGVDADGDGIGDTPYEIDANNQDRYPLITPVVWNYFNPIPVVWEAVVYPVALSSNSTILTFKFNQPQMQISFDVTGPYGTIGFSNVTIPKSLLKDSPWAVTVDGQPPISLIPTDNVTHTFLYFTYTHASTSHVMIQGTEVIPEFPKWTSILLILIVLTVAIAIYKRRLLKTPIH